MKKESLKLLLFEDLKGNFEAYSNILKNEDTIELVSTSCITDESAFWQTLEQNKSKVDMIVLDLDLGQGIYDGINILNRLKRNASFAQIKVVIFSAHSKDANIIKHTIQAGACGFFSKGDGFSELIDGIKKLHFEKMKYLASSSIQAILLLPHQENLTLKKLKVKLTRKEYKVFLLLGAGYNPTEIADKTFKAYQAIDSHKRAIKGKVEKLKRDSDFIFWILENAPELHDTLLKLRNEEISIKSFYEQ